VTLPGHAAGIVTVKADLLLARFPREVGKCATTDDKSALSDLVHHSTLTGAQLLNHVPGTCFRDARSYTCWCAEVLVRPRGMLELQWQREKLIMNRETVYIADVEGMVMVCVHANPLVARNNTKPEWRCWWQAQIYMYQTIQSATQGVEVERLSQPAFCSHDC